MDNDLKNKLEQKVDETYRLYLMQEIPKGEALLKLITSNDPEWEAVISPLTRMYGALNRQLGTVCQHLKYPLNQNEWPDSKPLEVLAELYEGIQATNWYQYHLGEIMLQSGHPWMRITT